MDKIKIFYAHSNNKDEPRLTYELISKKYENNNEIIITDVDYNDKNNSGFMLEKLTNHINDADIFIADITIDDKTIDEEKKIEKYFQNPNAMIELGYALQQFGTNNIILIKHDDEKIEINKSNDLHIPSLLKGLEITYYNYNNEYDCNKEYTNEEIDNFCYPYIIDKIENTVKNIKKNKQEKQNLFDLLDGCHMFNYSFSKKIYNFILEILDFKCKDYKICYNIKEGMFILFLNRKFKNDEFDIIKNKKNIKNYININKKEINYLEYESKCLSFNNDLYEELKHLEVLIKIEMLKKINFTTISLLK